MMPSGITSHFVMKENTMSRLAARFLVQAPGQPLILRVMSDVLRALILRKSRQDLGKLDSHLLRDIGLTAAQAHVRPPARFGMLPKAGGSAINTTTAQECVEGQMKYLNCSLSIPIFHLQEAGHNPARQTTEA